MKNRLLMGIVFLLLFFSSVCGLHEVHAEENMSPNFTVNANLPENQLENITGYFHVALTPGQDQHLTVDITNTTNEVITVIPSLATATTNSNGVISYKETGDANDESLLIDFKVISRLSDTEIVLDSFETKTVTIFVEIPEPAIEGQLLGGVSFEEKHSEQNEESSAMVVNRFSYNVAVMIEIGDEMPENELQLNEVFADQRSGFNYIEAKLQNTAERMISSLAVEATISRFGEETPMYISNRTGLKMAPNSNFNYGIDLQQTPIQPGEYTIHLMIEADDKIYEFEKAFMVTSEEANHLNESAVLVETPNNSNLIIVISLASGVLVLIICLTVGKKMKARK
ncbi:DUF916 and DUF3324 domain-containing protein [Enterococcus sp. AZ012]|uniref:DUF916 and DUF3324 domain-containing protein n=1 Tax=unclassified Enterococcus TaxID=2608891 RepID=UPI003D26E905